MKHMEHFINLPPNHANTHTISSHNNNTPANITVLENISISTPVHPIYTYISDQHTCNNILNYIHTHTTLYYEQVLVIYVYAMLYILCYICKYYVIYVNTMFYVYTMLYMYILCYILIYYVICLTITYICIVHIIYNYIYIYIYLYIYYTK